MCCGWFYKLQVLISTANLMFCNDDILSPTYRLMLICLCCQANLSDAKHKGLFTCLNISFFFFKLEHYTTVHAFMISFFSPTISLSGTNLSMSSGCFCRLQVLICTAYLTFLAPLAEGQRAIVMALCLSCVRLLRACLRVCASVNSSFKKLIVRNY